MVSDTNEQKQLSDEWKLYLYILKCAIYEKILEKEEISKFSQVSASQMLHRAEKNGQRVILYKYIKAYAELIGEELEDTNGKNVLRVFQEYDKYRCLRDILRLADEKNIHFVIFKGCVLADLYPQYAERTSSDTDMYVTREERDAAIELLRSCGYEKDEEHSKGEVTNLVHIERFHTIELHTCLWEDYEGKRLSILDSFDLTNIDKRVNLNVCGGLEVTTLGYQEHLIYQFFHIIKHFSLQGIGMRYLADITLYVNAYGKYIDFDEFWKKMEELNYTKFCYYLLVVCAGYLGMDASILQGRNMEMGEELFLFMQDLLQVGSRGQEGQLNWQIFGSLSPYFTGEKKGATNKWKRRMQILFPRAEDLRDDFAYAKKVKILLPIAWGHKIVMYLVKYQNHKGEWYNASEKLEAVEYRLNLMKDMDLIEKE